MLLAARTTKEASSFELRTAEKDSDGATCEKENDDTEGEWGRVAATVVAGMPKKRGRPPKSPLSSSKTNINEPTIETITPSKNGMSHLDEDDLEDIENLSPKQAA
ncbi:hypothetical protein RIF29_19028 [Crotalaria pallida]|uniref:Uncharacterized protein n=1 Tax=Crotalaria pallida TaxID=3830 RepID=A0AAN9EYR7_CROPI